MIFQSDLESQPTQNHAGTGPAAKTVDEGSKGPALVAYIFVLSRESELAVETLRNLTSRGVFRNLITLPVTNNPDAPAADPWLPHSSAAEYLGISESTLYRYAEQGRIECRKMCGRLQYRLASLDKFKDQHVRPARRSHRGGRIISSALSSGE